MNPITPYGIRSIGTAQNGPGAEKAANIAVSAVAPVKANPNSASPVRSAIGDLASQGAPVDEARVANIREALANGSYVIDTQKLADKMLELDLGIAAR